MIWWRIWSSQKEVSFGLARIMMAMCRVTALRKVTVALLRLWLFGINDLGPCGS